MRFVTALLVASSLLAVSAITGCAANTSDANSSDPAAAPTNEDDIKKAGSVSGADAATLMDALQKANAPSDIPAGNLGVGGRVARISLTTAQGGMAHFISEAGELSSVGGLDLGSVVSLGLDWKAVGDAIVAGGVKWNTVQGDHGASSSTLFAKVECKQVVSPTAKPTCTVSPIVLTAADSATLMQVLMNVDAPSDSPAGEVGVGSRIAKLTLVTSQGGMAHFISEGLTVETVAGKSLGDLGKANTPWADISTALLNGSADFTVKNGANGASSSTIVAQVECSQVVAPSAKPTCTVTPE